MERLECDETQSGRLRREGSDKGVHVDKSMVSDSGETEEAKPERG